MFKNNEKKSIHSVKYNFIMNFILTATQFLFPLITFPYVSRVLGAAANGKVSFAASVANYFMLVASLGIPTYGIRACAQVRDDKKLLSKTVKEIFAINMVMTVLVVSTYLLCINTIPRLARDKILFYINGANILLNMFGMNWVFQALEQYDYITIRSILFKIISIGLMFILVHTRDDYVIYGEITVFAAVGSYILNFVRLQRIIDWHVKGQLEIKKHINPILVLFAQSLAVSIYTNLDTVMLGFLKTDTDVGDYNASVKIKSILLSLVSSLGNVLLPRMSYYAKNGMIDRFKIMTLKALNFTVMLAVPLSAFFVLFGKEAILLLAGSEYLGAVLSAQIITLAVIPNGLTGVLGVQVLTAIEKEKCVLYSVIAGAATDFILNLLMIPRYGAAGAALATLIAEIVVLFIQIWYTREILIELKNDFRAVKYVFCTAIAVIICLFIKKVALFSTFFILFSGAMLYFGVYGVILLITKEPVVIDVVASIVKIVKKRGNK